MIYIKKHLFILFLTKAIYCNGQLAYSFVEPEYYSMIKSDTACLKILYIDSQKLYKYRLEDISKIDNNFETKIYSYKTWVFNDKKRKLVTSLKTTINENQRVVFKRAEHFSTRNQIEQASIIYNDSAISNLSCYYSYFSGKMLILQSSKNDSMFYKSYMDGKLYGTVIISGNPQDTKFEYSIFNINNELIDLDQYFFDSARRLLKRIRYDDEGIIYLNETYTYDENSLLKFSRKETLEGQYKEILSSWYYWNESHTFVYCYYLSENSIVQINQKIRTRVNQSIQPPKE
jgi:hypothetical protein